LALYLCRFRAFARLLLLPALLVLSLASCAHNKHASKLPAAVSRVPQIGTVEIGRTERGIASWYGEPYHGRRAANGEVYDMNQFTAAHRTLPFGTWVRVRNESNGKTVNVRITDRGPFVDKRIIDLSRKAAQDIALIGPGIGPVELTVIRPPAGAVVELYGVQVAAYAERERAAQLRAKVEKLTGEARLVNPDQNSALYRVLTGASTREVASEILKRLREAKLGGFVVRLDGATVYPQAGTGANQE
jgi:rare lipoprotein A